MSIKAYYFSNEDKTLRHGDGRKIRKGRTHKVRGRIKMCKYGLHGSVKCLDALCYAPGPIIWRVELNGDIIEGDDKIVASERTYIDWIDATDVLRKFTRMCALDVVHLWHAPDHVVKYLKTGDESLRDAAWAACEAARAPAWTSAWTSARDAAWASAWNAAQASAWDAARDAAWDAAWASARDARDAARAAARAAAREKQSRRLTRMVVAEFAKKSRGS